MKLSPKFLLFIICISTSVFAQEEAIKESKPQKKGFWMFSFEKKPLPPKDELKERMHSMQKLRIFDYVTVFQLEEEMNNYAEQAYLLKTRFKEREYLIIQERLSLIDELESLIASHRSGKDGSQHILRNYKKLYANTKKMHELGIEHAQDLQKLSQEVYDEYQNKIDVRMASFEKDPEELCNALIKMHDRTGGGK